MSKRINNSKIVACMLALGFMAVGSGCTDSDFDLSSIDSTIGLGGDGLLLPACSTEDMLLDDVLDLNNSDFISIADNGDYIFTKDGEDMTPAHPNIDKVEVTEARINNDFKVEIPVSALTQAKRKSARREKLHTPASVEGKAIEFHYTGTAPYEIRELTSAKCSSDVTIRVNVTNELKKVVPTFKTMTIQLPSYMKLNVAKCSPMQPEYDAEKGIVTFRNVSSSANIALNATVNRLDLKTKATKENHLTFTPGKNDADGFIDLNGEVLMGVTFDEVNLGNNSTDNLYLSASMSLGTIVITEATGKFDPEIKLEDLGSVDINDVPDFLTDKDVTIDLYNPVIDLVVTSDIDVAGVVYSTLTAEDEHGNNIAKVVIPKMTTKPNTKTHICICKRQDGVDKSKYDEVIEVPNLSDIVKRIPKRIRYVAEAHADATREGTLVLGKEYTIYADYSMSAPLAFDEGAQIVYTDSIDGWNSDIDQFSFADGAYIELTTDIDNKVPAYLEVSAYAIDVDGKEIAQNRIKVDVSNNVKASADGETAVTTPVRIQLSEGEKGALKTVDGLVFRIAAASGKGSEAIVGKTINAYKHTLTARNIKVKLVGKIIADLN